MSDKDIIESEAQELVEYVEHTNPLDIPAGQFKKALKRRGDNRNSLLEWVKESLEPGVDFMRVYSPKRQEWSKPFLTKAGAEKICGMLGVIVSFPNLKHYEQLALEGRLPDQLLVRCVLTNADGCVVAEGIGARHPGNQDYGDLNKAFKMAKKSAMIDATLTMGGLSAIFSQDPESAADDDDIIKTITKEQCHSIMTLASEVGMPLKNVCDYFSVNEIEDLPQEKYLRCIAALEKKRPAASTEDEKPETGTPAK